MALDQLQIVKTIQNLFADWKAQREEALALDQWVNGNNPPPSMPAQATQEYRELQKSSPTPILGLVVTTLSQSLFVDGFRLSGQRDNATGWKTQWQANGMDAKQIPVHRAAVTHGMAYVKVLPGQDPLTKEKRSVWTGVSARRMCVWYDADDPSAEWPVLALQGDIRKVIDERGHSKEMIFWELLDDNDGYKATSELDGSDITVLPSKQYHHGSGVCPVREFSNLKDIDGNSVGEVKPNIAIAARLDQDTFDRLVVQRFGSWKVRYISGMAKPTTDEEGRALAMRLKIEDLLVSTDKDTKFGTLDATDLKGYIEAHDTDLKTLAAVTQTPPHFLLGAIANLSAEALAAASAGLLAKVGERKTTFGEDWEACFRLGAWQMGDRAAASAFDSQVIWRDTESRSLVQTATALGILAVQLQVPFEMLWEKIPGWSQQDTTDAKAILERAGGLNAIYAAALAKMQNPGGVGADAGTRSSDRETAKGQAA